MNFHPHPSYQSFSYLGHLSLIAATRVKVRKSALNSSKAEHEKDVFKTESGWKLIISVKPPRSLSLGLGAGKSLHSAEKGTSKQKPTGWVSSQRFPGSTQNRAQ